MAEVVLCAVDSMSPGTAKRFDVDGVRVALARVGDAFYALGDRCSHEDFSLAEGEVDQGDCTLECARHGAIFDLCTGQPLSLPATTGVATYATSVVDGNVIVELP